MTAAVIFVQTVSALVHAAFAYLAIMGVQFLGYLLLTANFIRKMKRNSGASPDGLPIVNPD